MNYKKTQFGWILVVTAFFCFCFILVTSFLMGHSGSSYSLVIAMMVLVAVAVLFHSLTIEITETYLRFYFGFGIISKTILMSDIEDARPVRNSIIAGLGIRVGFKYTLYSVSGFEAVELDIKGKKRKIRIGTDEPEVVVRFLKKHLLKNETE